MWVTLCDECGKKDTKSVQLATGQVHIDGKYHGQGAHLCKEHYPGKGEFQPKGCKRVVFHWPESLRIKKIANEI